MSNPIVEREPWSFEQTDQAINAASNYAREIFRDPKAERPETFTLTYLLATGQMLWPCTVYDACPDERLGEVTGGEPDNPEITIDEVGTTILEKMIRSSALPISDFYIEEGKKWEKTHKSTSFSQKYRAVLDPLDGSSLYRKRVKLMQEHPGQKPDISMLVQASGLTLFEISSASRDGDIWQPAVSGIVSLVEPSIVLAVGNNPSASGIFNWDPAHGGLVRAQVGRNPPVAKIASLPRHEASYQMTRGLFRENEIYPTFGGEGVRQFLLGNIELGLADMALGKPVAGEYKSGQPWYELANWATISSMLDYPVIILYEDKKRNIPLQAINVSQMMNVAFTNPHMPRLRVLISRNQQVHKVLLSRFPVNC